MFEINWKYYDLSNSHIRIGFMLQLYVIQNVIRGVAYSLNILHHSRLSIYVTHVSFLQTDNRLWKMQSVLLESIIYQKQAELNGLGNSVPFKIIIFCF